MRSRSLLLVGLLVFGSSAALAEDPGFKLVVNVSNPVDSLTRDEAARFFLKKTSEWPNGRHVAPVDEPASSEVRAHFSKSILEKSVAAVAAYWQQRIFSGRDIPPPERPNDAEVIVFVKGNIDAIGYVSAGAATTGVKVIRLRE